MSSISMTTRRTVTTKVRATAIATGRRTGGKGRSYMYGLPDNVVPQAPCADE